MCILCVVQKWSRRVATMLPWLVIPLIGLWALSQLLPPGFRFEVTSPRLACVLVLLVTLFWYEILMPQLSIWRTRRIARLRERKRFEAIEMQKLRKMATRRCRNCSTPYRDQNPGGGKFMCSYCGHISKRPVLDIPGSAGLGITNSGIIGDLVSKGGKILNGKAWSENSWMCGNEWRENGNWVSGSGSVSFAVKSSHWGRSRVGFCSNEEQCTTENSYSGVARFAHKLLGSFFLWIKWLWRKMFGGSSSTEDASLDADHKGMLLKKGENGVNFNESKGEKARRKAEERRQARLERELLEEEEKKQREEVARLVEERRRLRDETMEAEKEHDKGSVPEQNKDSKRDAERKRNERRKEKDKGSSKSNSDVEDIERKAGKESEKKREYDKKSEIERRLPKTAVESVRHQSSETGPGTKLSTTNSSNRGTGGRYLDRVKGSFLSSSKAFNGASFFGKSTQTSGNGVPKTNNPNGSADHAQPSSNRREAVSELPPRTTTPKKSWQQLFTRSPAVPATSYASAISQPNQHPQPMARGKQLPSQASPTNHFDNQIHFGVSLPLNLSPIPNVSTSHTSVYSSAAESALHCVGRPPQDFIPEEQEFFGDPCYVPDPVSLLGPVSESLDNFPLDLGTGFVSDKEFGKPYSLKNVSVSAEVTRPSPIESPMSRLRVVEERHNTSGQSQSTPKTQDLNSSPLNESSNAHEPGTWQMWSSPPLVQDGLGLVGGPASWLLPMGQNKSIQGEVTHPSLHKDMISQLAKENQVLPGTCSPQRLSLGNCQMGGAFNPLGPGLKENDPWLQKNVFQQSLSNGENNFPPLIPGEDIARNEKTYGSPVRSAIHDPFELSPANCWSNGREEAVHGSGEGVGNSTLTRPPVGGLFSTPDVQSLWSFN
ncbi:hypothetical protein BVC80_1837g51 [Macleaya cordata]|uniref:Uncharacterized protein n=1 Tax=Macleaya cordata TaxID=56857 RepID=A0A200R3I5_MACCD|nr:hypothetical protein BVC80_1837g51 [Macleaya cordata]